jgi:hypothetical protein
MGGFFSIIIGQLWAEQQVNGLPITAPEQLVFFETFVSLFQDE